MRAKPHNAGSLRSLVGLPLLIAVAVFSTSRLLFWNKEVEDWAGYCLVHLLVTATIWSMLSLVCRLPGYHPVVPDQANRSKRNPAIGWLIMLALLLLTVIVAYYELASDSHPMFR